MGAETMENVEYPQIIKNETVEGFGKMVAMVLF